MICERCGKPAGPFITSMFNTQNICLPCKDKEREHPNYPRACGVELDEVAKGNYNFKGIGLPADL